MSIAWSERINGILFRDFFVFISAGRISPGPDFTVSESQKRSTGGGESSFLCFWRTCLCPANAIIYLYELYLGKACSRFKEKSESRRSISGYNQYRAFSGIQVYGLFDREPELHI